MRVEVLGPVRLVQGDRSVEAPPGNVGALLRLLLLEPARPVPSESLCASIWPTLAPESSVVRRRLQVTVSRLRTYLRQTQSDGAWTVSGAGDGYLLGVPADGIDRLEFEALGAAALDQADRAVAQAALDLWRGEPYDGFPPTEQLRAERAGLHTLRRQLLDFVIPSAEDRLLSTRVRPPRPAGPVLTRTALHSTPDVGSVRVLAVVAPAGFGKSTFLAQWADRQRLPVAWLTLDEGDDDPARLWPGIGQALGEALGDDAQLSRDATFGSTEMLDHLAEVLGPELRFGLVLDDLHHLTDARAVREVTRLLAALPQGCTVAVASRDPLPFPAARLAAEGSLHHVDSTDLTFDATELAELTGGDRARARRLLELTEGWPVAAVTLHRASGDLPIPAAPVVEHYVADEIVDRLPAAIRQFVLEVSHLDAFTVDLCEVVTGRADAGEALGWLRDRGLFLVETGQPTGEGWCRFHPVVAEVARRLGATTVNVARIWRRAGAWHRDRGMPETALEYAVRTRDRLMLGELAGSVLVDAALRGQATRCVQWLRRIDPEDLTGDPRAHGIGVYLAVEWMDQDERGRWLRSRLRHFAGDDDAVWALVLAIQAMREGQSSRAVEQSERVMQGVLGGTFGDVAELGTVLIGSAYSNLIRARVLQGTTKSDDELFPSAVKLIRPHSPVLAAWVHSYWGLVAYAEDDLELARSLAEEFFQARVSRELGRPVRRDNSMLGALLAADSTGDLGRLQRIAEGIEDLPPFFEANGQHTEATIARLILARILRLAEQPGEAEPHQLRAEAHLRTFSDSPFLHQLLEVLATDDGAARPALDLLTPRQQAIARHLATELSAAEIADELFISYQTVRTHLREIYRRLGVRSRHEAVVRLHGAALVDESGRRGQTPRAR